MPIETASSKDIGQEHCPRTLAKIPFWCERGCPRLEWDGKTLWCRYQPDGFRVGWRDLAHMRNCKKVDENDERFRKKRQEEIFNLLSKTKAVYKRPRYIRTRDDLPPAAQATETIKPGENGPPM